MLWISFFVCFFFFFSFLYFSMTTSILLMYHWQPKCWVCTIALQLTVYLLLPKKRAREWKKDLRIKGIWCLKKNIVFCLFLLAEKNSDFNWIVIKGWHLQHKNTFMFCPACHLISFPLKSHCDRTTMYVSELQRKTKINNIWFKLCSVKSVLFI